VNSTPPSSSYNCFTCLEGDTPIEPVICAANSTEVVQTHSYPPTPPIPNRCSHLPAWEHRSPVKYVVAASPGPMSLVVKVEIESTDTMVRRCTQALIDCGTTGCAITTQKSTAGRQRTSKYPTAQCNAQLVELKTTAMRRYGSQ
jgi:hypothetical protein